MVSYTDRCTRYCALFSWPSSAPFALAACCWLALVSWAPDLARAAAIRSPWTSRSVVAGPPGCETNSAACSSWSKVTRPSDASSELISPAQNAATSRSSATCWSADWSRASMAANASVPLAPTATSMFAAGGRSSPSWPGPASGTPITLPCSSVSSGIGGLPPAITAPLTAARVSCG